MAAEAPPERDSVPAAGERVHMPGPSYLPIIVAASVSLAVVGVVISPIPLIIGSLIFLIVLVRWIREARAEMSSLPLD